MRPQSFTPRKQCMRALLSAVIIVCIKVLAFASTHESIRPIQVAPGWNLLSLSVCVSNGSKNFLFPSSVSPAYIFIAGSGYTAQDTLCHGMAFWLKFDSSETLFIRGDLVLRDMIEVQLGWNMIGALSAAIPINSIQTDPPGIISSEFSRYVPGAGYQQADTLVPGFGYWVKVNQSGSIVLPSRGLPCPGTPTVTYAGKVYNTAQIGSQCWLRENLDVGFTILGTQEQTNNGIIEKYCYDNNPIQCDIYGGLYQWNEAMQYNTTPGVQGICPPGWHIPTLAEFQTLSSTVGGDGNSLKEIGQGAGAGAGTNTSGFSGLLAGYRYSSGDFFYYLGFYEGFWSSTENNATYVSNLYLNGANSAMYLHFYTKDYGFSIRCIKD